MNSVWETTIYEKKRVNANLIVFKGKNKEKCCNYPFGLPTQRDALGKLQFTVDVSKWQMTVAVDVGI